MSKGGPQTGRQHLSHGSCSALSEVSKMYWPLTTLPVLGSKLLRLLPPNRLRCMPPMQAEGLLAPQQKGLFAAHLGAKLLEVYAAHAKQRGLLAPQPRTD